MWRFFLLPVHFSTICHGRVIKSFFSLHFLQVNTVIFAKSFFSSLFIPDLVSFSFSPLGIVLLPPSTRATPANPSLSGGHFAIGSFRGEITRASPARLSAGARLKRTRLLAEIR